jgi:hypothetical protein
MNEEPRQHTPSRWKLNVEDFCPAYKGVFDGTQGEVVHGLQKAARRYCSNNRSKEFLRRMPSHSRVAVAIMIAYVAG